jgi:hypothetical protein
MRLKRLFLIAAITSLCVTALVAIGVLLAGSFDDTTGQILATTALIGGYSLLSLPAGMLLDRRRAIPLAWVVVALSAAGLLGAGLLVWEVVADSEPGWKTVGVITAVALAGSQIAATTGRRRPDDPPACDRLYRASIGTGVAFVSLICVAILAEVGDDTFYRILGAVTVLNLLVVLLQPAVRRLAAPDEPRVHRFRCTLDRLPDPLPDAEAYFVAGDGTAAVECRIPAADFAGAVETAVRALESDGARVTTIERREIE